MKKWIAVISLFCTLVFIHGIRDLIRHPDMAQGLGFSNYVICLFGSLVGCGIGLWAFVNMIRAKGIKKIKME
jgi:hypothetical protein